MGSSLLVFPATAAGGVPGPIARMADSLLQNLMEETKRLVREKEYAIHAVAAALLEHGELIGHELEDVFLQADLEHAEQAGPFERKIITLPKLFEDPAQASGMFNQEPVPEPAAARCEPPSDQLTWHDLS